MINPVDLLRDIVDNIQTNIVFYGSSSAASRWPQHKALIQRRNAIMRDWYRAGGTVKEIVPVVQLTEVSVQKIISGKLNSS